MALSNGRPGTRGRTRSELPVESEAPRAHPERIDLSLVNNSPAREVLHGAGRTVEQMNVDTTMT